MPASAAAENSESAPAPARGARARVRAELTAGIIDVARTHLARDGAAALSLRAVARDMGMVSSAIYRYFPSRDDLLTALIVDGYDRLADAAEAAEATCDPADHAMRWRAVTRAVLTWARQHPQEYGLLYGTPVPGYAAPPDTIAPATRVVLLLGRIVRDIYESANGQHRFDELDLPDAVAADMAALRDRAEAALAESDASNDPDAKALAHADVMIGVDDAGIAYGILAWIHLYGHVSFEVFNHLDGVVDDHDAFFDWSMASLAHMAGLATRRGIAPRPTAPRSESETVSVPVPADRTPKRRTRTTRPGTPPPHTAEPAT